MANWRVVPRGKYMAKVKVFSVETLGFIGCYGDADMESLC